MNMENNNKKGFIYFNCWLEKNAAIVFFYFTTILLINKNMFNFKKHGMKKNYVTTAVALLLLAGCSNDIKETDIQFTGDTGAKVSF